MEELKNLHTWPMDMNEGGGLPEGVGGAGWKGANGEKSGQL